MLKNRFTSLDVFFTFYVIVDVHGIIMFLSWGILLPIGGLLARNKSLVGTPLWFNIHQILQPVAYGLAFIGFIIAFIMTQFQINVLFVLISY